MFFDALQSLVTWWSQSFFEVSDWQLGVRTRTWDEVMAIVDTLPRVAALKSKGGDVDAENAELVKKLGDGGDRLRTVKSLMKKALQQEGGRDTSAQLFVALCRALGLGARLVVSLQAVPWRAEKVSTPAKGKNSARGKGKGKEPETPTTNPGDEDEDEFEEVIVPPPGEPVTPARGTKRRADGSVTASGGTASGASTPAQKPIPNPPPRQPLYRLRKPKPQKLGTAKPTKKKKTGKCPKESDTADVQICLNNLQYSGLKYFAARIRNGSRLTRSKEQYARRRTSSQKETTGRSECYMWSLLKKVRESGLRSYSRLQMAMPRM
jgi:xeroderma pigmentosum group C-complementing protein